MEINKEKINFFSKAKEKLVLIKKHATYSTKNLIQKIDLTKIKKFSKIPRNCILIGCIIGIALAPGLKINASASNSEISSPCYYQISDDGTYLYIEGDVDLSILKDTPDVEELYIYDSNVTNTTYLEKTDIQDLTFDHCKFSNEPINLSESTSKLYFNCCEFENLKKLSNSKQLVDLKFSNCNIGSLVGIENSCSLETLHFENTGIEDIYSLKRLENLNNLTLSKTCVQDLSPLENTNISYLDISDSLNIQNLDTITKMKNLSVLEAKNCQMAFEEDIVNYLYQNNIETNITYDDLQIKAQIKNIVQSIITNDMDVNEKVESIVNYVIDNIEYDFEAENDIDKLNEYNQDALKYALQGKGCCRNYTALTSVLLKEAGISSYELYGNSHIWNLVKIENEYYSIDSTWIDSDELDNITLSDNFMTNSDSFNDNHQPSAIPSSYYAKINNIELENPETYETLDFEEEEINITNLTSILKDKKASFGAIVGIAAALGSATVLVKKNKKNEYIEEHIKK